MIIQCKLYSSVVSKNIDLPLVKLKPLNTGKIITVTNRKRFWFGTDKKCGGVKLVSGIPPITSCLNNFLQEFFVIKGGEYFKFLINKKILNYVKKYTKFMQFIFKNKYLYL